METIEKNSRMLRISSLVEKTGIPKSTIYAKMKNGLFPQPYKLGTSSFWKEQEIDEWLMTNMTQRRNHISF